MGKSGPTTVGEDAAVTNAGIGRALDIGARGWWRLVGRAYAARVPIHERFHVHRDHRRVLRTDHELRLYRARVLRLHYRLEPI
jgi:hypothetical protein